jgi:peptidoglycan/xylan/chitin deacetylase (PgdA/CDA1 family)
MPRFSPAFLALFLTLPLLAADEPPVATILCYHEVDAGVSHETIPRRTATGEKTSEQLRYTATPEAFREQLDYLAQNGYHVIPLAELVDFLKGRRAELPPRAVVITVDDGWKCAYTDIFPELRRRGLPWTLFIYPHIVGRGTHAVTWPQVAEMARAGVDIESHSYSHPFLTLANNGKVTPQEYPAFLQHELAGSKETIEEKTGKPVHFLCYPFGDYDPAVIAAATKDGYEAGLTTTRAPITRSTSPMALTRYLVHNDTTLEQFKGFLVK